MSLEFYRSRVTEPYVMGYFASSKVNVVNEGTGIIPRLEVHAVNMENNMLFLLAIQMFLGTGRVAGDPAAAVLYVEEPNALCNILQKYVLPDPLRTGKKAAAQKALKALKTAGAGASSAGPASGPDNSSSAQSTPGASGSSSSTQHATAAAAAAATGGQKAHDVTGGSEGTDAGACAADRQRDQHKHICAGCGGKGEKRCSVCRTTWYCGRDCQKADWAQHKKICKPKA